MNSSGKTQTIPAQSIAQRLDVFLGEARTLADSQFESYALGYQGQLYEQQAAQAKTEPQRRRLRNHAKALTQKAIQGSEQLNLDSLTYQWLWQQGRLLKAELAALPPGSTSTQQRKALLKSALKAYQTSVGHVDQLRGELIATNRQSRLSFRQRIKPIYQDYIELLIEADNQNLELTPVANSDNSATTNLTSYLDKAVQTADSLQVAQLTNFFRADCLIANEIQLEKLDAKAAIIYPIIFEDHIETIAGLPSSVATSSKKDESDNSNIWIHNRSNIGISDLNFSVNRLRDNLAWRGSTCVEPGPGSSSLDQGRESCYRAGGEPLIPPSGITTPEQSRSAIQTSGEKLYDALIRPFAKDLKASGVETLVFMSSGPLQNIPMAALYDSQTGKFLIEQYAIATSPSLQLLNSEPLAKRKISAVLGGLTTDNGNDLALAYAGQEIDAIQTQTVGSTVLVGNDFTQASIESKVSELSFPVVHLATHGKFGSSLEETYVVTADDRLNANELSTLLQGKGLGSQQPIELLVLSACETAKGDELAALGLAGIAVRSGARSTLGSLWLVDDQATALLMQEFYEGLSQQSMTRAEALRQAQLSLLHNDELKKHDPYFWAAFVLIGSWL